MEGGGGARGKRGCRRGGRGGGGGRRGRSHEVSSLLETTLPDMFNSDLSDQEDFGGFNIEELEKEVSKKCGLTPCEGGDADGECLFPEETSGDEAEFVGFTEQDV